MSQPLVDVHMGLIDRAMEAAEAEAKAQHERDMRVALDNLKALQELLACPGWQVFKNYCKSEHQMLMRKMEGATDPTVLARLVGINLAVEAFPDWPERYAQELAESLKESP